MDLENLKIVHNYDLSSYSSNSKNINDPIHGYINLSKEQVQLIDTPQFQRLRNLHQNGSAYMVFPGASHRRFEHSIGVSYLAGRMVDHLRRTQPELDINDRDVTCVKLAGLCHDLGHGPFSHLFDNEFIKRVKPDLNWNHEEASNLMLDYMIDENSIDLPSEDVTLIKSMIHGITPAQAQNQEKGFLFDIVANQRNGMDVDKYDYCLRDCHNIGIKCSFDLDRMVELSRVIDGQICYHKKQVYNVYEMFHTRYNLFKLVCANRVCRSLDMMITDVFLNAEPFLKLSEKIFNMEDYMHLNDGILEEIYRSKAPELNKSRELVIRIKKRQLYRFVDEMMIPIELKDRFDKNTVTPELISTHQSSHLPSITPDDLLLDFFKIHYGKGQENPVDYVRFFDKHNFDESFNIPKAKCTIAAPDQFLELSLRIFARDPSKVETIKDAFHKLLRSMNIDN